MSVLWLPENHQNAREPRASPASGCGSERSTPPVYIEDPSKSLTGDTREIFVSNTRPSTSLTRRASY